MFICAVTKDKIVQVLIWLSVFFLQRRKWKDSQCRKQLLGQG